MYKCGTREISACRLFNEVSTFPCLVNTALVTEYTCSFNYTSQQLTTRTSQHQVPSQIKLRLLLLQRGAQCSYITFSSVPLSTPTHHRSHAHSPLRRLHPPRLRPALHCHHPPGPISLRLLRRPHRQRHPPCPHLPPITPGRVCPGPPVLFLLPVQIRYAASPEPLCYARNLGRQRVGVEDLASVGRLARSRS
ncbi:hypothetical protein CPB85DRAFT_1322083, partial [Mucidula mucida]